MRNKTEHPLYCYLREHSNCIFLNHPGSTKIGVPTGADNVLNTLFIYARAFIENSSYNVPVLLVSSFDNLHSV